MSRELKTRLDAAAYPLTLPTDLAPTDGGGKADKYVQQGVARRSPEDAPFRRKLDLWALGLAVAIAKQLPPYEGDVRKFVDTRAVDISLPVASLVFTAAVAKLGPSSHDLDDTRKVLGICSQYAGAGAYEIISWMSSGDMYSTPLEKLMEQTRRLRQETGTRLVGVS